MEGGEGSGFDCSVAAGEALDGEEEEFFGAGYGGSLAPGAAVGQGEVPGAEAGDGDSAGADEGVAGEEGSVALVEEGEMAGDVSGGFDGAEGAVEVAFGEELCGAGGDAGEAAFDLFGGLAGLKGFVGWLLQEGEAAGVDGEFDFGGGEFGDEVVYGAGVVHVGVGEEDAADRCSEGVGGGEDGVGGVGEVGVEEGKAVGLADEVAVEEMAEAGELVGVGGDGGGFH